MPLIRFGPFATYAPTHGFATTLPGFVPQFASLSPWFRATRAAATPVLSNPVANIAPLPSFPKRRSNKKPKQTLAQAAATATPVVTAIATHHAKGPNDLIAYGGLEYECPVGHRFFFHTPVNQMPIENASPQFDSMIQQELVTSHNIIPHYFFIYTVLYSI